MRCILIFVGVAAAAAGADEFQVALISRARTDFERVQASQPAKLEDAARCQQSQAALLPVATAADAPRIHARKGYCALAEALQTHDPHDFLRAAQELDQGGAEWTALATVARLKAGESPNDAAIALRKAGQSIDASVARHWLGWLAARDRNYEAAAREFAGAPAGWAAWVEGRQESAHGRYTEAAAAFRKAVELWLQAERTPELRLPQGLDPAGEPDRALYDLGAAELSAANPGAAVLALDQLVQRKPIYAKALALRARAKELLGQAQQALADYNLASRAAYAEAGENPAGEAHLYRGILNFRRKQYAQAEDEFARALNQPLAEPLQPDAKAWRYLAAVVQGSCGASRNNLEAALGAASPWFPRDDARAALAQCRP